MPNRNAIPASVAQDSIIAETEKAEEMKERKEREKERQQREEKYKKELQEYYKKAQARNNPDAVSDKPAKKKLCIILWNEKVTTTLTTNFALLSGLARATQ